MPTYQTEKIRNNAPPRAVIPGVNSVSESFTFTTAPATNDLVEMFWLPRGAVLLEMILDSDDLDTNASPTISLQVGDSTTADRFISTTTIARTGGVARLDKTGQIATPLTADTKVIVKVSAGPATGTTGTIRLTAIYNLEK